MTTEQLKAWDEANRIFQDRMNEEAKINANIHIPELPENCDGVILKNFGPHKLTAFFVKDKRTQTMSF